MDHVGQIFSPEILPKRAKYSSSMSWEVFELLILLLNTRKLQGISNLKIRLIKDKSVLVKTVDLIHYQRQKKRSCSPRTKMWYWHLLRDFSKYFSLISEVTKDIVWDQDWKIGKFHNFWKSHPFCWILCSPPSKKTCHLF